MPSTKTEPDLSTARQLTAEQELLKQAVIEDRGYWHPFHDGLLRLSPQFLRSYMQTNGAPWRAQVLPRKVIELILIAIDASVTHLYDPGPGAGLSRHVHDALHHGASPEEVLETLMITMSMLQHCEEMGIPILVEEWRRLHGDEPYAPDDAEGTVDALKADLAGLGYWPAWADALTEISPDYAKGLFNLLAAPTIGGALEAKTRELIHIALNVSPTTLYEPGVRRHVRKALELGATPQEVGAVFQLAAALATHSLTLAVPMLMTEMKDTGTW